jgi:putative oxidoreductase
LVFDPMTRLGLAGILETFGGFAIVLGLFTRPLAFVLAGEMAVAYFTAHFPRSMYPVVNQGEPAVLYCFIYLYLMFAGAGPWSIDAMIARAKPAEATSDADRRRLDAAA